MAIKPVFENAAKSNDNENLKFVGVNTQQCRDCAQAFGITSIP
jgi:thiol-disulfide isomerase/thioredoxin